MPVYFPCPDCRKALQAPSAAIGTDITCPECRKVVPVPQRAKPVSASAGRPAGSRPLTPGEDNWRSDERPAGRLRPHRRATRVVGTGGAVGVTLTVLAGAWVFWSGATKPKGLDARLSGEWVVQGGGRLVFQAGNSVAYYPTGGGPPVLAKFRVSDRPRNRLTLEPSNAEVLGDHTEFAIEFLGDDELVASKTDGGGPLPFSRLGGTWRRKGADGDEPPRNAGTASREDKSAAGGGEGGNPQGGAATPEAVPAVKTSAPDARPVIGNPDFSAVDYAKGPDGQALSERVGVCELYQGYTTPEGRKLRFHSREPGFERGGQWVRHGLVRIFWDEAMTKKWGEEAWFDGTRHGPIRSWDEAGQQTTEGAYQRGNKQGPFRSWHHNGQPKAVNEFSDGKRHGTFVEWNEGGERMAETVYEDDRLIRVPFETREEFEALGPFEVKVVTQGYRSDGKTFTLHGKSTKWIKVAYQTERDDPYRLLVDARFVHGKQQGKTVRFQEEFVLRDRARVKTGNLTKAVESEYKDGNLHGPYTTWNDYGQKELEGEYRDGKKVGKWTAWQNAAGGLPLSVVTYADGEPDGPAVYYRDRLHNGVAVKDKEGRYEAGKQVGAWTHYKSDGTVFRVEEYVGGVLVSKTRAPSGSGKSGPPGAATSPPAPNRKAGEWTRLDPLPDWKTVWGKWTVKGQTLTAAPDGAEHWKTRLLDREFDSFRATVAVRRPGKPDGWAGFDFGHRAWNDRELVMLHQKTVAISRSRPDVKGVTERKTVTLNAKAAASPWAYFRVECEGGRVRVEGSSDGDDFHPVYEAAADGYRAGRVGFSVREGGHGGEFRLVSLETRDAPPPRAEAAPAAAPGPANPVVSVKTSLGEFRIELLPDKAPRTVESFLAYVDDGWYDGIIFHHVAPKTYVHVQAGGFGPGLVAKEPTRPPVPNEAGNGLAHVEGSVAMARPPSASPTTWFFVNLADNTKLLAPDPAKGKAGGYAVFGKVVAGMEVVNRIKGVRTRVAPPVGGQQYNVPVEDVMIVSIRRVP